ncbi:MAG: hypothetical protein LC662_14280 [Rhodothermaceae bacterium]|nr:hypothetical protein [Rhodothermaceae bacterium]
MSTFKHLSALLLPLLTIVLVLQACSPKPVFRMSPVADETSWLSGREYVVSDHDSVMVVLAYYRHMGDLFYYDIEIVNFSDEPLRVSPEQFYYTAYTGDPLLEGTQAHNRVAVNPEEKLLEHDLTASKVDAERRTTAGLDAAFLTLSVVGDMVALSNDASVEEMSWRMHERTNMVIEMEMRDERFRRSLDNMAEARNIWELDMLRKTDLQPDEYVRGMVAFPLRESAQYYDLIFTVNGFDHRFRYEQFRFIP